MSMTIGRCALNENPYDFDFDGNVWTFTVDIVPTVAADINEMKARRQQLSGLDNNADEPAVPVTWSEDSTFDGYYRVLGVSVPSIPAMLTTGWIQGCQITLERVTGYSNAILETTLSGALRTNAHSYTTMFETPFLMVPTGSTAEYDMRSGATVLTTTPYARTIDVGAGTVFTVSSVAATYRAPTSVRVSTAASDAYFGGAMLEIQYGGTWYTVIGRDIPRYTYPWRISNGFIRLTSENGATSGFMEIWDSGAWRSTSNVTHMATTSKYGIGRVWDPVGAAVYAVSSLTVLRNTPETVTVKVSAASQDWVYSMKRAANFVGIDFTCASSIGIKPGVGFTTNTAATATVGGEIHQTANDANGNRLVFTLAEALTSSTANGYIYTTANVTRASMAIGVELNGTGSAFPERYDAIVTHFMSPYTFHQRVVRR